MSEVVELNNHRLLNGDATCPDDVNLLIGDCKVDLLLTDPPYGIDIVKIGGGRNTERLVPATNTQANSSNERERERAYGNNRRSKTTNIQEEQSEYQQDQHSKRGGQPAYGKVGKPKHCSAKTLQTSNR